MKDDFGPLTMLLFNRVVKHFPASVIEDAARRGGPVRRYPDGSVQFDVPPPELRNNLQLAVQSIRAAELAENSLVRNLAAFPPRRYDLFYDMEYHRKLRGGECFHAGVPISKRWPGEYNLADLLFTVHFRRRPAEKIRKAFAEWAAGWLKSVASAGLWDEGPVFPVVGEVEFRGTRANIHLDASRTGPYTMMYLVLAALEFGHNVATLISAVFNYDDPLSSQTMLQCLRDLAASHGETFDEEDERKWWEEQRGGPGPSIVLPLS